MKYLLDTSALLWWLVDDDRLGLQARDVVGDPGNDILVSVVSLWEVVVKLRIGKLEANIRDIADAVDKDGFTLLDIGIPHLRTLARLPMHHRDPFDHLLIAQAAAENAIFISDDRHVAPYPVRVMGCSGTGSPMPPRTA